MQDEMIGIYRRVLPRDLFNEAKLLKCLGQVCLLIHEGRDGGRLAFEMREPMEGFHVQQSDADGSLECVNLDFYDFRGRMVRFRLPYNSRAAYPLLFIGCDGGHDNVFQEDGSFAAVFLAFLSAPTANL